MPYNNSYNINFQKLALLLLPTFLRRSILGELAKLLVYQLAGTQGAKDMFDSFRGECNFRLIHNGQRCYLRGCLNEIFDSIERRIRIEEAEDKRSSLIFERNDPDNRVAIIPANDYFMLNARGFVGGLDFTVLVPQEILDKEGEQERIKATVNTYKLASKQFIIKPL